MSYPGNSFWGKGGGLTVNADRQMFSEELIWYHSHSWHNLLKILDMTQVLICQQYEDSITKHINIPKWERADKT